MDDGDFLTIRAAIVTTHEEPSCCGGFTELLDVFLMRYC